MTRSPTRNDYFMFSGVMNNKPGSWSAMAASGLPSNLPGALLQWKRHQRQWYRQQKRGCPEAPRIKSSRHVYSRKTAQPRFLCLS